ncbi:MAG: DUF4388 domain-containing protein [Desulfobacteraceae bacterium]|nr:DUF4388 domain-containing protein [Desulfobacteraceae bacterium]
MALKITNAIAKRESDFYGERASQKNADPGTFDYHSITQDIHLKDYMEVLIRRKWILISVFTTIVMVACVISFLSIPKYQATAQVLLGGKPTPGNPLGENYERMPERNLYYKTQITLLKNLSLARSVIKELELEKTLSGEFDSHEYLTQASANSSDNKDNNVAGPESDISANLDPKYVFSAKVLKWYLNRLIIMPVHDTSLVNIAFTGSDPALITRIVNKHAHIAIERTVEQHQAQAKDALDWLRSQIEQQKKEVQSAQKAIYEFKKKHNVLSMEDHQTIFSQEMLELNKTLTKAKSDRITQQAIYLQLKQMLKNKKDMLLIPEISNYSVIQNLRNQLVDLKSQQIEMGTKYGPKHPKMIELSNGINQIKNEIGNESNRLKKAIKTKLDRATAIEISISKVLKKRKKKAMSLGKRSIEYAVLKQQAQSNQQIYDFLLKQSEELSLSSAISSSNMRIVDKAQVPIDPVSPNIVVNIFFAVCLGLFTGAGLAFFVEYFDNTVKTPLDVAIQLNLPVLGTIPFFKALQQNNTSVKLLSDLTSQVENEPAYTPMYQIANRLPAELRTPTDGLSARVLVVESVTMNEGKSTIVSQVAANLTEAGLRVLLVDCDLQRPCLDKLFKTGKGGGLGKSIDRIMSHQLTSGTLNDYSMDDLFFLIGLKRKSGHLMVKNDDQTFIAHFKNGIFVHIQNPNNPENNRIGAMLLNGNFITKDQLKDALQRHQRIGQPLGYILVNAGYITRNKLKGPLRLQTEEYLHKIFSLKNGKFIFKPGMISIYDTEKIFFKEDYTSLISNLGSTETSKYLENELFSHIISVNKENLYLLPAGTSRKFIGSLNQIIMKKIFEKLKPHFDVILIDTPPLDAASGIESTLELADGIILVVKAGHLSIKVLNSAIMHLPKDKIIGAVLNQSKINPQSYYY